MIGSRSRIPTSRRAQAVDNLVSNALPSRHCVRVAIGPGIVVAFVVLLVGCGATGQSARTAPDAGTGAAGPSSPVETCRRGDRAVASEAACLQDDASCYPRADGQWCTGPREPVCPAGSVALADGLPCPVGERCFEPRPGLRCVVQGDA